MRRNLTLLKLLDPEGNKKCGCGRQYTKDLCRHEDCYWLTGRRFPIISYEGEAT